MRNTKKNGPHMTGPNADAAASCGDDALSHKNKLERRKRSAQKKPEGSFIHNSSCAADGDISAGVNHNIPLLGSKTTVGMLLALTDKHRKRRLLDGT